MTEMTPKKNFSGHHGENGWSSKSENIISILHVKKVILFGGLEQETIRNHLGGISAGSSFICGFPQPQKCQLKRAAQRGWKEET